MLVSGRRRGLYRAELRALAAIGAVAIAISAFLHSTGCRAPTQYGGPIPIDGTDLARRLRAACVAGVHSSPSSQSACDGEPAEAVGPDADAEVDTDADADAEAADADAEAADVDTDADADADAAH